MKHGVFFLVVFLIGVSCPGASQAVEAETALSLSMIFSDNMVIQEGEEIRFWGTAPDKAEVEVTLDGLQQTATAGNGAWQVRFPAMQQGGPYEIAIRCGAETKTLSNVLIGDVWLASGQSNMQWPVNKAKDAETEITNASYPKLRIFTVKKKCAYSPLAEVEGTWQVVTPETIGDFSAVGYYFGRHIQGETGRNIGVIASAYGGSTAEAWVPEFAILAQKEPFYKEYLEHRDRMKPVFQAPNWKEKNAARTKAWKEAVNHAYEKDNGSDLGYQRSDVDDGDWPQTTVPSASGTECFNEVDGIAWFRKTIDIPAALQGRDLELHLGRLNMFDAAYVNGEKVGSTFWGPGKPWHDKRVYPVPAGLVADGQASIAVFILVREGHGGFMGEPADMVLRPKGDEGKGLSLAGAWRYKVHVRFDGEQYPARPPRLRQHKCATVLYNAMIHPLVRFPIKGVVWYQGESNADKPDEYLSLFPLLIRTWRDRWRREFPFFFVQLANYRAPQVEPFEGGWAPLREAQRLTLSVPKTGMAVALDVGEEKSIHPKNKQEVGRRLGLIAMARTYGVDVPYSGPLYKSMEIQDGEIVLSFTHIYGGLTTSDGEALRGFAIAGADKSYHWAEARIEGDKVILSHPEVTLPQYAAYGWANNPVGNLCNREGLPASSFTTDALLVPQP